MNTNQAQFRTTAGIIAAEICKNRIEALEYCYKYSKPSAFEDHQITGYRVYVPLAVATASGQSLLDYSASKIKER